MKRRYFRKPHIHQIEIELQRVSIIYEIKRNVMMAIVSTLVLTFLFTRSYSIIEIQGNSMEPTLANKQVMLVKKNSDIQRGDLIVFERNNEFIVKRVIAKAADIVDVTASGDVYLNEKLLDEPYVEQKEAGHITVKFPQTIKQDQLFVLGDNRKNSLDSRSNEMGMISEQEVIGEVIQIVWPLSVKN